MKRKLKQKKYSNKEFIIVRIIAIIFSILYFITRGMHSLPKAIKLPEVLVVPVYIFDIFLPFVVLICWYMCYERYMCLMSAILEEEAKPGATVQIKVNIAVISILGIAMFINGSAFVTYIFKHWEYLDKIQIPIFLWIACTVAWIICFSISLIMLRGERIRKSVFKNIKYIAVLILLIVGSILCYAYAGERGEEAWYYNMVEEAERGYE